MKKRFINLLLLFLVLFINTSVKAADVTENFTVTDAKACSDANCTIEYNEENRINSNNGKFLIKLNWSYLSETAIEDGDTVSIPFGNERLSVTTTDWSSANIVWNDIYDSNNHKIGKWRVSSPSGKTSKRIEIVFSDYAVGKRSISGTLVTVKNIYSQYSYRDINVPFTVGNKVITIGLKTYDLSRVSSGPYSHSSSQTSNRVKWGTYSPGATVKKLYLYDDYTSYDELGNDALFDSVILEGELLNVSLNSNFDLDINARFLLPTNETNHEASNAGTGNEINSYFMKIDSDNEESYDDFRQRIMANPLSYGYYFDNELDKIFYIVNFGDQPSSTIFYDEDFIRGLNANYTNFSSYFMHTNPFTYYQEIADIIERANGLNNVVNGAASHFSIDYSEYFPEVFEDTPVSRSFKWTYTTKGSTAPVTKVTTYNTSLKVASAYSVVRGTAELHLRDKSDPIMKIDGVNITLQKNNNGTWEDVRTGLVTDDNGIVSIPGLDDGEYRFVQTSYKSHYVDNSLKTYLDNNLSNEITSFTLNGDGKIVYATNEREKFTITFKSGDHGDFEDQVLTVYYGDTISSYNATSGDGWDFVGWSPSFKTIVKEDATYTAQWEKKVNLTVHYYVSGTTTKVSDDVTDIVKTGDSYTTSMATDVSNYYEFVGTSGEVSGTVGEEDIEVIYYYALKSSTLTVNYVDEETGEVLSSKVDSNLHYGDTYNTSESDDIAENYTLKRIDGEPSGTVESSTIVVTYYYEKKDSTVDVNLEKTGPSEIISKNSTLDYEIKFVASIEDYIGNGTVMITDTLPYLLNESDSDLDGGTYNSVDNTITWTEQLNDIDSYDNGNLTVTKNISLKYSDLDSEKRVMTNNAKAIITLDNNSKEVVTSSSTDIKIPSKITVKYIDTETDKELKDTIVSESLVGESYSLTEEEFEGYNLVEKPETEVIKYLEEDKEYVYKYKKKIFNISTQVLGSGGTISGDEPIKYGEDSTPNKIVIKANDNYYIGKVLVNNEEIKIKSGLKSLTLDNFKEVKEDKKVAVIFNKELENPKTGNNNIIYYVVGGLLLVSIGVAIYLIRKKIVKRRL